MLPESKVQNTLFLKEEDDALQGLAARQYKRLFQVVEGHVREISGKGETP